MFMQRNASLIYFLGCILLSLPALAQNNPDPCPKAQQRFAESRQEAMATAAHLKASIEAQAFPRDQIHQQIVQKIESAMREDILETIEAHNATAVAQGKVEAGATPLTADDEFLNAMAKKKTELLLQKDAGKQRMAELMAEAEKAFNTDKAKAFADYDSWRGALDAKWGEEKAKLDSDCNYGAWAVAIRVLMQLFQIDTRVENGMLMIGDFKTYVPEVYGGKVMLGDHHLMNIPEIKGNSIEIGGTVVAEIPHVSIDSTGRQMFEWGNLKTDVIPRVDVSTGGDHGGLGVSANVFGTTIKF